MQDEEWVKTLDDGRKAKFTYQEIPEDGVFITAQTAGNEVRHAAWVVAPLRQTSR